MMARIYLVTSGQELARWIYCTEDSFFSVVVEYCSYVLA